ncbi:MAG: GtrA family protein [Clostridiales bacterium]|nr:GtrA family protein [Clostridiales bacterium]
MIIMNAKVKKILAEIVRFGIIGVLATLLDWGIFYVLTNFLGVYYVVSSVIGFCVSVVFNYLLSRVWVFHVTQKQNLVREFVLFMITSIIGLGINTLVLWLCVEWLFVQMTFLSVIPDDILELIGKAAATFVVMVWNYLIRKFLVFKKTE